MLKKISSLLIITALLFSFVSCSLPNFTIKRGPREYDKFRNNTVDNSQTITDDYSYTNQPQTDIDTPTIISPPIDDVIIPPADDSQINVPDYNNVPEFDNLDDVMLYVYEQRYNCEEKISFTYTGPTPLDTSKISDYICTVFLHTKYSGSNYDMYINYTPGERMVKAYRDSDTSKLTFEEKQALQHAISIVDMAKKVSSDDIELEMYLHNYIADNTTYYTAPFNVDAVDADIPRFLTVLGAFYDGKTNCQGYTDAFYVLGSIAGFDVKKISVTDDGEGHSLNTIVIGGKKYLVDVTYNDCDDLTGSIPLMLVFNAGMDMACHLDFHGNDKYLGIQSYTDENNFYLLEREYLCGQYIDYHKVFATPEDMANEVFSVWQSTGCTQFNMLIYDNLCTTDEILSALANSIDHNFYGRYHVYTKDNGRDTVCNVVLTPN